MIDSHYYCLKCGTLYSGYDVELDYISIFEDSYCLHDDCNGEICPIEDQCSDEEDFYQITEKDINKKKD
jgi:hypothetical protein